MVGSCSKGSNKGESCNQWNGEGYVSGLKSPSGE